MSGERLTPTLSVAVIGHVNHGKTALVRALTGIQTDRLKEEIARGLSITLGFAWRDYPGAAIDFIDAPGHEDFLRAMVMGATGARAVLLVVSATEGVARQTREHLRIAALLGIRSGVVAITKADLLAANELAAAGQAIAAALGDSVLADAPMVFCSSVTGAGVETLHGQLQVLAARSPPPARLPGAYLPIDRVFTVAGSGTVVTGTLLGGALLAGEEAVLEPSGRTVGIRQVQIHGQPAPFAPPGGRVAVGLRGVSVGDVPSGEVLCEPGCYATSRLVDVELTLTPDCARSLRSMDEVRVMWGARQDMAKVRLIGPASVGPGERTLAQLRFSGPIVAYAGQRAVLRRPSPAETIGGVLVLDPTAAAVRGPAEGRRALLKAVVEGKLDQIAVLLAQRDRGVLSLAEVARLSRRSTVEARDHLLAGFAALDNERFADRAALDGAQQAYLDCLAEAHRQAPARMWVAANALRTDLARLANPILAAHVEQRLAAAGEIRLDGGRVRLAGHDPLTALAPQSRDRLEAIETALRKGGTMPPDAGALPEPTPDDPALIALLVDAGQAIWLRNHALRQTLLFHVDGLAAALKALREAFPHPAEFTTGEARAALGTTRKFIVPMLELFDAQGVTVRQGDVRQVTDAEKTFGVSPNPL